jgi:two-component system cell cycle response regulator CpdR
MRRKENRVPKGSFKPLEVLVADDTPQLQALITNWLEDVGHTVTGASNGREIVELVKGRSFDLLVTDILMPGGDGWDAIAEVHRMQPKTRILAISGGALEMPASAVLRVAQRAGAFGFLAKPFSRPEFLEGVMRVVAGRQPERRSARS